MIHMPVSVPSRQPHIPEFLKIAAREHDIHKLWGKGKVLSVSGTGKSMILKLQFPGQQVRQVMAAFAPLEKED